MQNGKPVKPPPKQIHGQVIIYPENPPPLQSYDNHGDYQRALDRRLNCVTPPPPKKYDGMVAVICPITLRVSIGIDLQGNGEINRVIEIEVDARDFEGLHNDINGQTAVLYVTTVRPLEKTITMENVPMHVQPLTRTDGLTTGEQQDDEQPADLESRFRD